MYTFFSFENAISHCEPFNHVLIKHAVKKKHARPLLKWFETGVEWEFKSQEGFYDLYAIDVTKQQLPDNLNIILSPDFIKYLRRHMEKLFCTRLSEQVEVQATKMVSGNHLRFHTDFDNDIGQSHRLLIQINRGWSIDNGGILFMRDSPNKETPSNSLKYYLPFHGSSIAFEISEKSYHAVSPVKEGDRYTLTFSFHLGACAVESDLR